MEVWYQQSSTDAQDGFDAVVKNTAKIPNHLQWGGFKFLKGKLKEERIWQLDFVAEKRQYRIFGIFGEIRRQAVILSVCYHKGDNYTPPDAMNTASKRAKNLRERRATTIERKIEQNI